MSNPEKLEEAQPSSGYGSTSEQEPVPTVKGKLSAHFSSTVETRAAYIPLLILCFVTGLTDGTLYNGNTIFIALGTSGQNNKPYGWARSLCSLGCFAFGCVSFSRLHKLIGGHRLRRTLLFSFSLQTVCVVTAASIIQSGFIDGTYPSRGDPGHVNFTELAAVALLSFQAAGQIVNSRGLGVAEVPTVVITTLLCDLVSDEQIFAGLRQNGKRNRRAVAFVLTLSGAICGGRTLPLAGGGDQGDYYDVLDELDSAPEDYASLKGAEEVTAMELRVGCQ
ncbi:hypothetical protein PG996_010444 [Apiospora saccharicola]|uniref:DUF1275 domain protein n=1 Tax=Apiospora saccharicola TaxID=335842 RepID=A0ABR1URP8_9PEZI